MDSWTMRTPDALVDLLPFPGPARPDVKKLESSYRVGKPATYQSWPRCVQIRLPDPAVVGGDAEAELDGETVPAEFLIKASTENIASTVDGTPCHAYTMFDGFITLNTRSRDKTRINFKMKALVMRLPE
jgi:hypothetical protein